MPEEFAFQPIRFQLLMSAGTKFLEAELNHASDMFRAAEQEQPAERNC
jgi:hypothetical protein